MPRYFSVEEANRALPLVRRIVEDIVETYQDFQELLHEYRRLENDAEAAARRHELERRLEELAERVNRFIDELTQIGVLFKGFDAGLVDFYGTMEGRPVFLCWKLGEESVEWWHELEAGYAGRRRIPADLLSSGGSGT